MANIVDTQFVLYEIADPQWSVVLNRYGKKIIGIGFNTGRYCWSFRWARP